MAPSLPSLDNDGMYLQSLVCMSVCMSAYAIDNYGVGRGKRQYLGNHDHTESNAEGEISK